MSRHFLSAHFIATSLCLGIVLLPGCKPVAAKKPKEETLQMKAERGDVAAQVQMGKKAYEGEGAERDAAEAARWYLKAAEKNHPEAQFWLGNMYADGEGVEKNLLESVKWYRLAAEQNYTPAQSNLGFMYAGGKGVEKDAVKAYAWYNLAARTDEVAARNRAGLEKKMTPPQVVDAQKYTEVLRLTIEAKTNR